ncbi:sulfotransferase 2B1-like [Eublepharis macularius]|uniref:Sulfotransferase n=1 Tax=Eublepharis macularius TaxID=481883 RepID=A0AA97LGQ8_EUBMA|nr:sulfotransferase 2B1-like [Eublepharis macularius]
MSSVEYFTYEGMPFPATIFSEETFNHVEKEFQILDDDVINLTYPKSGTHWMAEILALISKEGDPTWTQNVVLWDRSPWIDTTDGLKKALESPPPRLLNIHVPFRLFPKSFLQSKAKVIYTLRNPKDVLVSYYHFSVAMKILKDPGTLQEFMEEFLSGNVPFGSWFDHVKGWMELKDKPNFFFITYEELQQDPKGCVEKICHFLGKELNRQQIDSVVKYSSFKKMKENKMSNYSQADDTLMDHKKGQFMRKGISGDWKNHLTVAQNEHFDRVYQEKMQGMSITFPWD